MGDKSGALLLWILVPLFAAVGFYLIWYSLRRKKMLEAFAKSHRFKLRPEREQDLQETLDSCFPLRHLGLLREFGQLAGIVEGEGVWLFRAVELLDLVPRVQADSTHYSRIVALFGTSPAFDEFFLLDRSGRATGRIPGAREPDPEVVEFTRRQAKSCQARHTLSVTLKCGYGLIYFEPFVTGGESLDDVHCLYRIAKNMHGMLPEAKQGAAAVDL